MKFRHFVLSLVLACIVLVAPLTAQPSLEGVYTVQGVNPNSDKVYVAVLEIKANENTPTYLLRWTTGKDANGEWNEAYGYGYISEGRLIVIIQDEVSQGLVLADYTSMNGVWKGTWSPVGSGLIGTEECTKSDKTVEFLKELLPVAGRLSL